MYDIAEILLKLALNTNKSINQRYLLHCKTPWLMFSVIIDIRTAEQNIIAT
jgi:hypothetical protein